MAQRGWKEFYVTHELIHYRQAEEIGNITVLLKPSWQGSRLGTLSVERLISGKPQKMLRLSKARRGPLKYSYEGPRIFWYLGLCLPILEA